MNNLFRRFTIPRTVLLTMLIPIMLVPLVLGGCYGNFAGDYDFVGNRDVYATNPDGTNKNLITSDTITGRLELGRIPYTDLLPMYLGKFYNMNNPEYNVNVSGAHSAGCLRPLHLSATKNLNGKKYVFEFNFCGSMGRKPEFHNDYIDWFSLHTDKPNEVRVYNSAGDCERVDYFTYIFGNADGIY